MTMLHKSLILASAIALFTTISAYADCDFNVEIKNKSNNLIAFKLTLGSSVIRENIAKGGKFHSLGFLPTFLDPQVEITDGNKNYKYKIKTKANSKIYLSWDPSKSTPLYPQTGPFLGVTSKTDSGCLKADNIKASDITKQ